MSHELELLLSAFRSSETIDAATVLRVMGSDDLAVRGVAYHFLQHARNRIVPEISVAEQCSFMLDYLFECLLRNPESDDYLHSGFEAARELAGWVKLLDRVADNEEFVSQVVQRLTESYLATDGETRNRIEIGAVEHMMESPSMRKYFAFWEGDSRLSAAHALCLQWGKDHEAK